MSGYYVWVEWLWGKEASLWWCCDWSHGQRKGLFERMCSVSVWLLQQEHSVWMKALLQLGTASLNTQLNAELCTRVNCRAALFSFSFFCCSTLLSFYAISLIFVHTLTHILLFFSLCSGSLILIDQILTQSVTTEMKNRNHTSSFINK